MEQNGKTSRLITLAESWQMRGVAMLMILFVHSINEYPETMHSLWARWLLVPHWGIIGSAVFLLLSGYGMLCSLQKRGGAFEWGYWLRKAKGLALPYLAAFGLTALTLSLYDGKLGEEYKFNIYDLLKLNLSDGNELWFFKTIAAEYVLLLLLNLFRLSARTQVVVMGAVHVVAIALMASSGMARYWWASDAFFVLGMCTSLVLVRPRHRTWSERTSRLLTYVGRNSICFYLLEIPVMWILPSDVLPWPMYFASAIAATALLTEVYRRTLGRF